MEESDFTARGLEALLRIQEEIIASGAPEEVIRQARNERNRLLQCLNMLAGPLTRKPERSRYFVREIGIG